MCDVSRDASGACVGGVVKIKMASAGVARARTVGADLQVEQTVRDVFLYLGYETVRRDQMDVILKFIHGKDAFVSLPTGSGKSMCFASLPLIIFDRLHGASRKSVVVVISPLNALMQDQVTKFTSRGMTAECVSAQCSPAIAGRIAEGKVQLENMSPGLFCPALPGGKYFKILTFRKV